MHLQYRIKLAGGEETDAPGAAPADLAEADPIQARPGLLAELARRIADAGIDIRLVSGRGIETGGVLVLAVNDEHGAHSEHSHASQRGSAARQSKGPDGSQRRDQDRSYPTTDADTEPSDDAKLKALLDEHGYRYDRVQPTLTVLDDHIGALAEWAEGVAREGRLIDTIALGTPEKHGAEGELIPLQATTIAVGAPVGAQQLETVTSGAP